MDRIRENWALRTFPEFCIKMFISLDHSSYELETWHEYSFYTHCKFRVTPTSCMRASMHVHRIQKTLVSYACWITARDARLNLASNVCSVKWRSHKFIAPYMYMKHLKAYYLLLYIIIHVYVCLQMISLLTCAFLF